MNVSSPRVDVGQVRRNFARAASHYGNASVVAREINARMLERLDYVKIEPQRILDLGCGTGGGLTALAERYKNAELFGVDLSEALLQAGRGQRARLRWMLPFLRGNTAPLVVADTQALPVRSAVFGLLWSNLMLHWVADPVAALREMHRSLEVGGLLMFSTLGPDTLKELRACFSDGHEHTLRFIDMHDYGDMLVECGFADPVMDAERLTVTYAGVDELFRDLRQNGATNASIGRRSGLIGRDAWRTVCESYEKFRVEGRLPATLEVVYGHAWKAQPRTTEDGRSIIRFDRQRT